MIVNEWLPLILLICVSSMFLYWALKTRERTKGLPPGPTPLPLLGNILQIERGKLVQTLLSMSKKYGSVFTIYFGSRRVVVLTGYQSIKEALVDHGDVFSGRGEMPTFDKCYKNLGFVFTNDLERWRQLRRFTVATFKDFGMGKSKTEDWIQVEIQHLMTEFRRTEGTLFNPTVLLSLASLNVICCILFGDRFDYDDKELLYIVHIIHEAFGIISSAWGQMYDLFPSIVQFIPGKHHQIFRCIDQLNKFSKQRVEMTKKKLDPNSPQNYIDAFLIKMDKEKDNPRTEFTMENLVCSTSQIIFAAADTTSVTVSYGLLMLLKYPEIQVKVQKEIDRVIGQNRNPTFQDRSNMPYTDAVTHEIQRFTNLVPFGAPRAVTQDVVLKGYVIPKGTNVFAMLCSVLNDPQCWEDPDNFNPKNFLDEEGNFKKNEGFMPFSAGKRMCIGHVTARMKIFLFLTTILQNFTVKSQLSPEDLDITPEITGLANLPKYYEMYVEGR